MSESSLFLFLLFFYISLFFEANSLFRNAMGNYATACSEVYFTFRNMFMKHKQKTRLV